MFQVRCLENHNNNAFIITVSFPVGAINESKNKKGMSHALEHMLFCNKPGLIDKLNGLGSWNAYTSYDKTSFIVITESKRYKEAIDTVLQTCTSLEITPFHFEQEKQIVKYEMDSTGHGDSFLSKMFPNTIYATSVIGTKRTVQNITYTDVVNHFNKYYANGSIVVTTQKKYKKQCLDYIASKVKIASKPLHLWKDIKLISVKKPPVVKLRKTKNLLSCIHLGFSIGSSNSNKHLAFHFLGMVLRIAMNSEFRFKSNMTYGTKVLYHHYKHVGCMQIRMCVPSGSEMHAIKRMIEHTKMFSDLAYAKNAVAKYLDVYKKAHERFKANPESAHELFTKLALYESIEGLDALNVDGIDADVLVNVANNVFCVQNCGIFLERAKKSKNITVSRIKQVLIDALNYG